VLGGPVLTGPDRDGIAKSGIDSTTNNPDRVATFGRIRIHSGHLYYGYLLTLWASFSASMRLICCANIMLNPGFPDFTFLPDVNVAVLGKGVKGGKALCTLWLHLRLCQPCQLRSSATWLAALLSFIFIFSAPSLMSSAAFMADACTCLAFPFSW
jgi:hypothetical protein